MKRVILICLVLAAGLLTGCVVTPAYRYSGGAGGYYYGQPYQGSTVVYGGAGVWYPYDYYYGPWAPYAGARVYYYDHDGGHGYRHDRNDRFATRFHRSVQRQYDGGQPRQPRSRVSPQRQGSGQGSRQRTQRGNWHHDPRGKR